MRLLTLIRHAKSDHGDPSVSDFDRPLNPRGLRDAPRMAKHLKARHQFAPDLIVSSPARRAITTARLIADGLDVPIESICLEPSIYEASTATLASVARKLDDRAKHVCLFGHNPGMFAFANWLACNRVLEALPTCGVVMLECGIKSWRSLTEGCAQIRIVLIPKDLED